MFKEGSPIAYDAPAELKMWPSLQGERQKDRGPPISSTTARSPNASAS